MERYETDWSEIDSWFEMEFAGVAALRSRRCNGEIAAGQKIGTI